MKFPRMTIIRNLLLIILSDFCNSQHNGAYTPPDAFPMSPLEPLPPLNAAPAAPQIPPFPQPKSDLQMSPNGNPFVPENTEFQFPADFSSMSRRNSFPHQKYFDTFSFPSASVFPNAQIPPSLNVPQEVAEFFSTHYAQNFSTISSRCPPNAVYGSFNPDHRAAVEELLDLYKDKTDMDSILQFSGFTKSRKEIHPHVWYAAFMKAQLRQSPGFLNIDRPSAIDLFPSEFFPDVVLKDASSQGRRTKRQFSFQPGGQCVNLDGSIGMDNGPENALWYFREDVQLNAHHFLWHILFPTSSNRQMPRRGEFFYFVHHDLLARYRTERLVNDMTPVDPVPLFLNENTVLAEGYNPHLTDGVSTRMWVPRRANTILNANTLPSDILTRLRNLGVFRQRIIEILNTNAVNVNGRQRPLSQSDNINLFGEILESSIFSINPNFYGQPGLHNDGHWVIANIANNFPAGSMGVMGHSATALRDMIFYRIHTAVDNLFTAYKSNMLPPYQLTTGDHPLVFPGITINSLSVNSETSGSSANVLQTFWSIRNFTLEGGLDYNPDSAQRAPNVNICARHLNHEEFTYSIQLNNARSQATSAYVRIYMAPRFKSITSQDRYTMEEQRSLFFVMDSFVQPLRPGVNTINRNSIDSALTAPWPRSIQQVRADIANGRTGNVNCECGFPHHLLLPRGTEGGMAFDILVHVTDAAQDFVANQNYQSCIPSHVHCGVTGQQYPDAKPMGYPFDRRPYSVSSQGPVPNLETYVSNIPNMETTLVTIVHRNIVV